MTQAQDWAGDPPFVVQLEPQRQGQGEALDRQVPLRRADLLYRRHAVAAADEVEARHLGDDVPLWRRHDTPDWAKEKSPVVTVPDIACFSTYDGDRYDEDEDVHDRVKYIMLLRVNVLLEEWRRLHAKQFETRHVTDSFERTMARHYRSGRQYDHQFLLGWGALTDSLRQPAARDHRVRSATQWRDPSPSPSANGQWRASPPRRPST